MEVRLGQLRGTCDQTKRNDAVKVRWMCNARPRGRTSAQEHRNRLKLNSMRDCLEDRKLQLFGHLERMEENAWYGKCRTFKVSGSFPRRLLRKTQNIVIKSVLKERKGSKDLQMQKYLEVSRKNRPTFTSTESDVKTNMIMMMKT